MTRSIIGFHYSVGGNKNGIGEMMRSLNREGIPFLLKGVDDAGLCDEGSRIGQEFGVENWLIYRVSKSGQRGDVEYDVPDYAKSPPAAAREHWEKTVAKWPKNLNKEMVWMEPINEPRAKRDLERNDVQWNDLHPTDWLGRFMLEYAKIANRAGFKVCGPSFNSGEPEVFKANDYELPGMLNYLRYCANNPTKAALAVHEYVWDRWEKRQAWSDWYPALWGRVEGAMVAAEKHGIPLDFPIFVTEWGFAHTKAPHWGEARRFLDMYNQWAAKWPQIKGVAAWTLQSGWGDVDDHVASWIRPLAGYATHTTFPAGQQGKPHPAIFRGSAVPTPTPNPKPTPPPVTPTPPPVTGTYGARVRGFSSNLDLEKVDFSPGESFTATWTFLNSGESTWGPGVELVYSHDGVRTTAKMAKAPMTPTSAFDITEIGAPLAVKPGETVSLTLELTAPFLPGESATHWRLHKPDGTPFGPICWLWGKVMQGHHRYRFERFDNSVADYKRINGGENFTITWTVRNAGTLPWPGNMQVAYEDAPLHATRTRRRSRFGGKPLYTLKELTGRTRVYPGESLSISLPMRAPSQIGSFASHWRLRNPGGVPLRGKLWMIGDVISAGAGGRSAVEADRPFFESAAIEAESAVVEPSPTATPTLAESVSEIEPISIGFNLTSTPILTQSGSALTGTDWVRTVVRAAADRLTVPSAFRETYTALLQQHASAGIKTVLVINEETDESERPWEAGHRTNWGIYAAEFAATCMEVAHQCQKYRGNVAYQLFDELMTDEAPSRFSAKGYAFLLKAATDAILAVDPDAIILSGAVSAAKNGVPFLKGVERASGGTLPVTALALHPAGVTDLQSLSGLTDDLQMFQDAFPELPLWLTRTGLAHADLVQEGVQAKIEAALGSEQLQSRLLALFGQ